MVMAAADVVVIGAGPAGSSAAGMLASRGLGVVILEREHFPRRKVCGEFLSAAALRELGRLDSGLREDLEARGESVDRGAVHASSGREVDFQLPEQGLGLSRETLDARLARWARERGAELRFGARVRGLRRTGEGFRVRYSELGDPREIEARAVVGAWGRWDALDRVWDRNVETGRRFLAWSRVYEPCEVLAGHVDLFLFPGGYCGLCRIESGAVQLAGIVEEALQRKLSRSYGAGWGAVLAFARRSNAALDHVLENLTPESDFRGAGPVYLAAKPPVKDGVLMAGDTAGVLDPFSGQGIALALSSGRLAARTLTRAFAEAMPLERVEADYSAAWKHRFASRFHWSTLFRSVVQRPALADRAARWVGPGLVRSALHRLAPPEKRRVTL
jgi:menaquinone-9 beta-reductase